MTDIESREREGGEVGRRRWRRWVLVVLGGLVVLAVWAVALLPWVLESESARRWMLARAGETLRPARLEVKSFRFSWFGPTRMKAFAIVDAEGEPVVRCREAVWDRNLFQILFDRPRYGTLRLSGAALDVERDEKGRVDLYEALRPVLNGPPETSLRVVASGRLRISSPGLKRPIEGGRMELEIRRPAAPEPMSWALEVGEPEEGVAATLRSGGTYERWRPRFEGPHELGFWVEGKAWPFWVESGEIEGRGTFSGRVEPTLRAGLWGGQGELEMGSVEVLGTGLRGDRVKLGEVKVSGRVKETEEGWKVEALELESALASVKTRGAKGGDSWDRMEGRFDLAGLVNQLPHVVALGDSVVVERGLVGFEMAREGQAWDLAAEVEGLRLRQGGEAVALAEPARVRVALGEEGSRISARVEVPEAVWSSGEEEIRVGAIGVELEGAIRGDWEAIEVAEARLSSPWGEVTAEGEIKDLKERRQARISGRIEPDWARWNEELGRQVEPGARVEGGPVRFLVEGALGSERGLEALRAEVGLAVDLVDVYGMKLEGVEILARAEDGRVWVEPIEGTLNGGRVRVEPVIEPGEEGNWTLRLGEGTRIEGAEVNDEVSRRVLSYVAPVLDRATRVNGRVSARLSRAEFPLGPEMARRAEVEGTVVFDDVAFVPGPLAENLMALAGRQAKTIALDEPILLRISDGKVHQSGLTVPVGRLTEFSVDGDVGFDRSLDLMASVPITSEMVGNVPVLGSMVEGARVKVPIGGTLDRPRIDRERLREEMKGFQRELLQRTATQGAADLLFRLTRPRPRGEDGLTPRERRQQRRMERRRKKEEAKRP